jgi:hypothetical protein
MSDTFADSNARLKNLLELATKESDPIKSDKLAVEIRRVLEERELLRRRLRITTDHEE